MQYRLLIALVLLLLGTTSSAAVTADDRQLKSAPIKPAPVRPGKLSENKTVVSAAPAQSIDKPTDQPVEQQIDYLDELIELGLPALALKLVNDNQANYQSYTPDWYRFERKRISVLALMEDWDEIIRRTRRAVQSNPRAKDLPQQLTDWFLTQQAISLIRSGQADRTLKVLQRLIWTAPHYDRSVVFALWRRLVIRAYLLQGNIEDAEAAMLRYDYDYRTTDFALGEDWLLTRAGVLLQAGKNGQLVKLLQEDNSSTLHAIYLLAKLRYDKSSASKIKKEIQQLSKGKLISKSDQWAYRYIALEIAKLSHSDKAIIAALEALLAVGKASHPMQEWVRVGADDLWSRYQAIGIEQGNRHRLLTGDDSAWYGLAMQLKSKDTLKTISVLAALALSTNEQHHRQMAHTELVSILANKKNSMDLITQLYFYSTKIESPDVLPVSVRASLVDHALAKKDISLAAKIMRSMSYAPEEQDEFVWQLRKARVMLLEGEYEQGKRVLDDIFKNLPELDRDKIDHLLQVLFDLQSVQQHATALTFFRQLLARPLGFETRRELYYWMAESSYALAQYADAAIFYLRSARQEDGSMNDQWALSARLKAAEALVKAGLYDDADTVYSRLLKVTVNESRKAMIEQERQHIYLLKSAHRVNNRH